MPEFLAYPKSAVVEDKSMAVAKGCVGIATDKARGMLSHALDSVADMSAQLKAPLDGKGGSAANPATSKELLSRSNAALRKLSGSK